MKLFKLLFPYFLFLGVSVSYASGGFQDDGSSMPLKTTQSKVLEITTVSDARNREDGTHVALEGYLVRSANTINKQEYMFRDESGTIKVEINGNRWRGQTVTPSTKIRILGEVDHNRFMGTTEIEVRELTVIE